MATPSGDDLADLLRRTQAGDADAERQLVALLYQDLRAIAARRMRRERPEHTWQPTLLVHEAFLRLRARRDPCSSPRSDVPPEGGQQGHAPATGRPSPSPLFPRSAAADGGSIPSTSPSTTSPTPTSSHSIELHDELKLLERVDARACMVVHFRFFLGMSLAEVGEALDISQKTVERDWRFARAWLRDRLKPTEVP